MTAFPKGSEVAHTETGEVMFVVAASATAVLVDRASGRWSYPPDKLRPREITCPIPPL